MSSSAPELFVIDGYNLMRRGFRFLEEGHGLEAARAKLEIRLREFLRAAGPGTRILLVYDGRETPDRIPDPSPAGGRFTILFSRPPRSADEVILELADGRRSSPEAPGRMTVVSSDFKDIAAYLPGATVGHQSSEEFADLLDETLERRVLRSSSPASDLAAGPTATVEAPEKPSPGESTAAEAEEWLRIFSQPKPPAKGSSQRGPRRPEPRPGPGSGGGSGG